MALACSSTADELHVCDLESSGRQDLQVPGRPRHWARRVALSTDGSWAALWRSSSTEAELIFVCPATGSISICTLEAGLACSSGASLAGGAYSVALALPPVSILARERLVLLSAHPDARGAVLTRGTGSDPEWDPSGCYLAVKQQPGCVVVLAGYSGEPLASCS